MTGNGPPGDKLSRAPDIIHSKAIAPMSNRRQFLQLAAALSAASSLPFSKAWADDAKIEFGEPEPFSFDTLIARAKELAAAPFEEPVIRHEDILESIDYDAFQQIQYKKALGLGEGTNVNFPAQLFHLGRYFKAPVKIHWLEQGRGAKSHLPSPLLHLRRYRAG